MHCPTGMHTSTAGAAKPLGYVRQGPTTPRAQRRVRLRSLGEQHADRHAQARRAHPRAEALTCPPSTNRMRMAAMRNPHTTQGKNMSRETGMTARQRTARRDNDKAPERQSGWINCTGGEGTRRDRHIRTLPAAHKQHLQPREKAPLTGAGCAIHVPMRAAFQNTPRNLSPGPTRTRNQAPGAHAHRRVRTAPAPQAAPGLLLLPSP